MSDPQSADAGSPFGWDPWSVMGSVARDPHRGPMVGSIPAQGGGHGAELTAPSSAGAASPFGHDVVGLLLTGYLDIEIRSRVSTDASGRFRWSFAPGVERSDELRSIPVGLREPLSALSQELQRSELAQLSLSWVDGERRHHLAPGRSTLAALLTATTSPGAPLRTIESGRAMGAVMRGIRSIDIGGHGLRLPAGPIRLRDWLTTGDGPFAAAIMHEFLSTRLGRSRTDEVVSWIDALTPDHLAIARSGLEITVVPEGDCPAALLIGDEISAAPRDFDLSWALGELLVLDFGAAALPHDQATSRRDAITACRDALLVAYGPTKDLIATGRMTALRVLLELHDAAAYNDLQFEALAVEAAALVDDAR